MGAVVRSSGVGGAQGDPQRQSAQLRVQRRPGQRGHRLRQTQCDSGPCGIIERRIEVRGHRSPRLVTNASECIEQVCQLCHDHYSRLTRS